MGFVSTMIAGTRVQDPRKLIIIHNANSNPEMAIFCRITTGTTIITNMPRASVMIPLLVGTNNSAKEATIVFSLSQFHFLYSS